jgi:hypothetical protein
MANLKKLYKQATTQADKDTWMAQISALQGSLFAGE